MHANARANATGATTANNRPTPLAAAQQRSLLLHVLGLIRQRALHCRSPGPRRAKPAQRAKCCERPKRSTLMRTARRVRFASAQRLLAVGVRPRGPAVDSSGSRRAPRPPQATAKQPDPPPLNTRRPARSSNGLHGADTCECGERLARRQPNNPTCRPAKRPNQLESANQPAAKHYMLRARTG
eukprot:6240433-Pyramimonas_sp.AAC.1